MGFLGSATQRVLAFQTAYNLGAWLSIDGVCGPKTSAAIARSIKAGNRASANFTWAELRCKCGGRLPGCRGILSDRKLLQGLERIRKDSGSVTIHSGYRCPKRNAAVGGAKNSQHMTGKAADINGAMSVSQVEAMRFFNGKGYKRSNNRVVHVDVRSGWVRPWAYAL